MKPRIVDPITYSVIESMVKDGLISGLPYSEYTQLEEFIKRMQIAQAKPIKVEGSKNE